MAEPDNEFIDAFKDLVAGATAEALTGLPSLDMVLKAVGREMSDLLCALSVPHWFDRNIAAGLCPNVEDGQLEAYLDEIETLPFVRSHPRGLTFHDVFREALR